MRYWPFVVLIMFTSCSDTIGGKAALDNLIPRDTMVLVLKDMILIESHIQSKFMHVSRFHKTMKLSGKKILDGYKISHNRFESSMDYYGSHQEQMQSIYTEILDSLNKEASILGKNVVLKDNSLQESPLKIPGLRLKDK
jgi:hypothetical protein